MKTADCGWLWHCEINVISLKAEVCNPSLHFAFLGKITERIGYDVLMADAIIRKRVHSTHELTVIC